jgi:D-alanine-D-alanine ligase
MKSIAIVCGGDSGEYDISVRSAAVVKRNLDPEKYRSWLVTVTRKGWFATLTDGSQQLVDRNDFSIVENGQKIVFDAVFNAIHGTPGENGPLTGYFEMLHIPVTSSGQTTSALTFHKDFCKRIVHSYGVNVAKSVLLNKGDEMDEEAIVAALGLPVFVKPNNGGSSVGTTKVKHIDELTKAIEIAFREDHQVLIESFIAGREMACGAMRANGRMIVFPITEVVSKKEFFDYEAKYTAGMADEITPADIEEEAEMAIKSTAAELYHLLECRGFVRFDFILTEEELYFLEVNIVPGISEASILPQQAAFMGVSLTNLFNMALDNILTA